VPAVAGERPGRADRLDRAKLSATLEAVHAAGMYGTFSEVRDGAQRWTDAAGVADVDTGRPVTPDMRQRVGSISKTFTAVAVLQQVERGRIALDSPVAEYLPGLAADGLAPTVTVRMLLNHTSGIGDYVAGAFPSLTTGTTESLDENRFRQIAPEQLVRYGLAAPSTGAPGAGFSYSNTNYVIAGLVLEKVTGEQPSTYITREVIKRAGLQNTTYPTTSPYISGPHSKMYESFYGLIDPPRDYSVYNMSWASTAGSIISTTDDLNRFYRLLLSGKLLRSAAMTEMTRTVPTGYGFDYGLGIYTTDLPCGQFWGHSGAVFGAGTYSYTSRDGQRQLTFALNLMKYQRLNEDGTAWLPSPIDEAIGEHTLEALCPGTSTGAGAEVSASAGPAATEPFRLPMIDDAAFSGLAGVTRK
jgi:D-alanyl-D-alanine carboxypeptidase